MNLQELQKEQEQWFNYLHTHPELSMREVETTAYLKKVLSALPVKILPWQLPTGFVAELEGEKGEGPTIALRADIDALPIEESPRHTLCSKNKGVMHACGHDFHTASLLGAIMLLCEKKAELKGKVKFLFQPAEEAEHGGQKVVETGILKDVDAIFGLHVDNQSPAKVIAVSPGPCNAACDRFSISITGKGCHGANPAAGKDPITSGAYLVTMIQQIISRELGAFEQGVVSVTKFKAGNSWNVIPDQAELEGTVRSLNEEVRGRINQRLKEICEGTAMATGTQIVYEWLPGAPALHNDERFSEYVRTLALNKGLKVQDMEVSMGGEDFSCYRQTIPGAFFHIGVNSDFPLHNPNFEADLSGLSIAADLLTVIVLAFDTVYKRENKSFE